MNQQNEEDQLTDEQLTNIQDQTKQDYQQKQNEAQSIQLRAQPASNQGNIATLRVTNQALHISERTSKFLNYGKQAVRTTSPILNRVVQLKDVNPFTQTNLLITGAIAAIELSLIWYKWYKTPRITDKDKELAFICAKKEMKALGLKTISGFVIVNNCTISGSLTGALLGGYGALIGAIIGAIAGIYCSSKADKYINDLMKQQEQKELEQLLDKSILLLGLNGMQESKITRQILDTTYRKSLASRHPDKVSCDELKVQYKIQCAEIQVAYEVYKQYRGWK